MNQVVKVKDKRCAKHAYWLVCFYNQTDETCKVAPMVSDGDFARGNRQGRKRWKVFHYNDDFCEQYSTGSD